MPFDPNIPGDHDNIDAPPLRAQFLALKALTDAAYPVGGVTGYLKNLGSIPALPGLWLECNGQTVSDAGSPLDGVTLPDLNGAQGGPASFLRGANASGGTGGSESHTHGVDLNVNGGSAQMGADFTMVPPGSYNTDAAPSLPTYYGVVWVVRVK